MLQIRSQNVFGDQNPSPNTVSEGVWSCKRSNHQFHQATSPGGAMFGRGAVARPGAGGPVMLGGVYQGKLSRPHSSPSLEPGKKIVNHPKVAQHFKCSS